MKSLKTKTSTQFYSKKQKLDNNNKLNHLKTKFESFYEKEISEIKIHIEKTKITHNLNNNCCKVDSIDFITDIKSKLSNNSFKDFYSKELNRSDQIELLLENDNQMYIHNKDINTEIVLSNYEYFTDFYENDILNFDFISLANHYLKLYGRDKLKNVIVEDQEIYFSNDYHYYSDDIIPIVHKKVRKKQINNSNFEFNSRENNNDAQYELKLKEAANYYHSINKYNGLLSNCSRKCIASNNRINSEIMKISNPEIPFEYPKSNNDYLDDFAKSSYININKKYLSNSFYQNSYITEEQFNHSNNYDKFNNYISKFSVVNYNPQNKYIGSKRNILCSNYNESMVENVENLNSNSIPNFIFKENKYSKINEDNEKEKNVIKFENENQSNYLFFSNNRNLESK